MPKPTESVESFLQRQPASVLATVLVELAEAHEPVRQRLARLQLADRPDKLATAFRKTLSAWRRSKRFYDYRESQAFGRELEAWLDQVARELLHRDPPAALSLFEDFIEADASWFERADDSDGSVGDAVRAACRHWLQAAALCETPASVWPQRLIALADADEYGAREELLRNAGLLLAEPTLTELVASYEARMAEALSGAVVSQRTPRVTYKISAALALLSTALRDPDVAVRAVLMVSPEPNAVQRRAFVRAYLDADRPADALVWLEGSWDRDEIGRQSLLAEALRMLGRITESAPIRQRLFEDSFTVFDFQQWLEHLPESTRHDAEAHARRLALAHEDPVKSALLLLELEDAESAEARLLETQARVDGHDYTRLVPLAKSLRTHGRLLGETVVHRALLQEILNRANARAYSHAARYWRRLGEIADAGVDLQPLQPHASFALDVRARHARKVAFWASVSRQAGARSDDGDEGEA